MGGFVDLPNELLLEVLSLLDNKDIENLYAVPQLALRLRGFVSLVSDTFPPVFGNLRGILNFGDSLLAEKFTGAYQAVVELHDFVNASSYQMVALQTVASSITISMFTEETHMHLTERDMFVLQFLGHRVRSATFEDLVEITLTDVGIDTGKLKFPHVKKLALQRVWVETPKKKLFTPRLEHLTVEETFRDIHECLDYESDWLKKLSLFNVGDVDSWRNVYSSSLEHIEVDNGSFKVFENLNFENLKVFTIDTTDVSKFGVMTLPQLRFLVIFNSEIGTSIHNLEVPSLKTLFVRASEILEISGLSCSCLSEASLGQTEGELSLHNNANIDTSIFETLSSLKIENCSEVLRYTPNLKHLTLNSSSVSENYDLPLLTELTIGMLCTHRIRELPPSLFQGLETIRLCDTSMIEDIDYMQHLAPRLKELVFDDHTCNRLIHKHVSGIQRFKVHSFGQLHSHTLKDIHLDMCHFIHLKEFHACYMCMSGPYFPSEFNFTAPELERVVIQGLDVPHLDLSGFPKLKSVVATGGIKKLTLGNCEHLEHLDLSDNKELYAVEAGTLKKLAYLKCDGTEYFLSSQLDAPLLLKD